ncbi:MAG TPA: hypothetical protein VK183_00885 [Flavobacterium sp.]|nr:hypothetical protein [Flavobacterium sp.]
MEGFRSKLQWWWNVNWLKTVYFNFRMFPFSIARQLPVVFYGKVHFANLSGRFRINAPIRRAMIGFGQPYENITRSKGTAELFLAGEIIMSGHVQFGKDYFVYVAETARLEMGHMASLGGNGKIMCYRQIVFGDYARLGFESQVMDSNFHEMIDTESGSVYPMTQPIALGNYNYFGNRISVMPGTTTGDYCTVATMSLLNRDYSGLGRNILIGGIPARLLKENISRNWEGEQINLEKWLIV